MECKIINRDQTIQKAQRRAMCFFLLYRKLRFRKAKKIICPAERPLRVLGDGQFENGRRVTAKPFSCFTGNCVSVKQKRLCSCSYCVCGSALRPRSYRNHTFPNTNEYGSGFPISSAVMLSSIRIIFRNDAICSHMRSRLNFSI